MGFITCATVVCKLGSSTAYREIDGEQSCKWIQAFLQNRGFEVVLKNIIQGIHVYARKV